MENPQDIRLSTLGMRVAALEITVRALIKTHPDHAALVEAVRWYEEGMNRSLEGHLPSFSRELVQSFLDQAGAG